MSSNTVNQNPSIWGQGNKANAQFDPHLSPGFNFVGTWGWGKEGMTTIGCMPGLQAPLRKGPPGISFLLSVSSSLQNNSVIFCCTYEQGGREVREGIKDKKGNLQWESFVGQSVCVCVLRAKHPCSMVPFHNGHCVKGKEFGGTSLLPVGHQLDRCFQLTFIWQRFCLLLNVRKG